MSASNWAVCPRCVQRARRHETERLAEVMLRYGKIPVAEFDAARAAIGPVREQDFTTFREDYEITGAESGTVTVSYGGGCDRCGLSLSFTESRAIPGLDGAAS